MLSSRSEQHALLASPPSAPAKAPGIAMKFGQGFSHASELDEITGKQQIFVDQANFEVAVMHAFDAQCPALLNIVETGNESGLLTP